MLAGGGAQGLDVYPRNPELLAALAEAETRAHTPSRLRRDLATAAAAAPSPFTWLLALRCEALRAAATLRLQACSCPVTSTMKGDLHMRPTVLYACDNRIVVSRRAWTAARRHTATRCCDTERHSV